MWRELISELTADIEPIGDLHPGPDFFLGATESEIADAERQVGIWFPDTLRDILGESNGIHVVFGTHLIWSTSEIVEYNLEMRYDDYVADFKPFDNLLFFADAGVDGIRFAMTVAQGIAHEHILAWAPIGDERELKANSLRQYIEGWLTGAIKV